MSGKAEPKQKSQKSAKAARRKLRKRAASLVPAKRTVAKAALMAAGTYGLSKALNASGAFDRLYQGVSQRSRALDQYSQAYQEGYLQALDDLEHGRVADSGAQ